MNDVLPKPFTKEGMLRTLEKHLSQFKKNYVPPQQGQNQDQFGPPNTPLNLNMSHMSATTRSIKDEASPGKSGSPTSSWHSPSQIGTSPSQQQTNQGFVQQIQGNPGGQYVMAPTHGVVATGYQTQPMPPNMAGQGGRPGQHRRNISDIGVAPDEDPNKRQRIYPPQQGGFTQ